MGETLFPVDCKRLKVYLLLIRVMIEKYSINTSVHMLYRTLLMLA